MTTRSPLAALSVLKKICDHPQLLTGQVAYRYGKVLALPTFWLKRTCLPAGKHCLVKTRKTSWDSKYSCMQARYPMLYPHPQYNSLACQAQGRH